MGNHYEADIVAKINNNVPKELMDKLVDMSREFEGEGPFIDIGPILTKLNNQKWSEYELDYVLDDNLSEKAKEFAKEMGFSFDNNRRLLFLKLEDYSIHEAYILHITCSTKYYFSENVEQKILDLIEELKPYRDKEFNYLGKIKDEDCTYEKDIYWDYEEFEKAKRDREFVCRGCNQPHENTLCEYFDSCKRAYEKGYKDHADKVANDSWGWDT